MKRLGLTTLLVIATTQLAMGDLTQEKFRFQSFSPEVEKAESSTLEIKDTKVAIFDILRAEGDELLTFLEDVDVDYSSIFNGKHYISAGYNF